MTTMPAQSMDDFSLPLLGGEERRLSELLADRRALIVVFWSAVCSHCRRYDAYLNERAEKENAAWRDTPLRLKLLEVGAQRAPMATFGSCPVEKWSMMVASPLCRANEIHATLTAYVKRALVCDDEATAEWGRARALAIGCAEKGLRGSYYEGRNFEKLVAERLDPAIDFTEKNLALTMRAFEAFRMRSR